MGVLAASVASTATSSSVTSTRRPAAQCRLPLRALASRMPVPPRAMSRRPKPVPPRALTLLHLSLHRRPSQSLILLLLHHRLPLPLLPRPPSLTQLRPHRRLPLLRPHLLHLLRPPRRRTSARSTSRNFSACLRTSRPSSTVSRRMSKTSNASSASELALLSSYCSPNGPAEPGLNLTSRQPGSICSNLSTCIWTMACRPRLLTLCLTPQFSWQTRLT